MKKTPWIWAAVLLGATLGAQAQQAARKTYIVQLADAPAAYTGQVAGYAATKPAAGRRFDSRAAAVQAYLGYLGTRQAAVLATVPAASMKYRYKVSFNGFAAKLTDAEANAMARQPGVVAVKSEARRQLSTSSTPGFLGLTGPNGLYASNITGENTIIGIIDSGITPEHPSFSDKVDANGKPVQSHLPGTVVYTPITNARPWGGVCQSGQGFPATSCNNKLIGARFFRAGFDAELSVTAAYEFDSPRDGDGHGSHTASTAGGNANVAATLINGQPTGTAISGIAPRARIAAYKVCWDATTVAATGCYDSDTLAAIDQAVADGVDVINYSISGTRTDYLDPIEVAFLFAADAGVFVAASAGNEGPGNTVAHMSPWVTTVAASTHDRELVATLTLGNGTTFTGLSVQSTGVPSATIVLAENVGVKPANLLTANELTALRRCYNSADLADPSLGAIGPNGALSPVLAAGKIVVCDRGGNARVNKSAAAKDANAVGMVQTNTGVQSLNADVHVLATIHLASSARPAVRAYAATGTGTASFSPSFANPNVVAPVMAGFSSRGPSLASPNILKPDITAPGVDVLAAVSPVGGDAVTVSAQIAAGNYPAPITNFISGTSMSSPHVAGMAALLRQAHPTWSPAAMKSALMTSTTGVKLDNGQPDLNRFGYGAGHANPNGASATGLVYDASYPDYVAFLCGAGLLNPTAGACSTYGFLPARNLNLASLTSEVLGVQLFSRTVTNVGNSTVTYTASTSIPGFSATVTPASLTLAPGEKRTFTVQTVRTTAPFDSWVFGDLSWSDGSKTVRSPVTLKAQSISVAGLVSDTRVRASKSLTLVTGYNGTMKAASTGMVPATRTPATVAFSGAAAVNCSAQVTVPAGAQTLRVALFNTDTSGGANGLDDLDLEVYSGDTLVGSSLSSTANETVSISAPAAGTYTVCVTGFDTARPGKTPSNYVLSSWVVADGLGLANSLIASVPAKVATGGTGTASLLWSVAAGQRYLGNVRYLDGGSNTVGRTSVYIDNQSPVVLDVAADARNAAKLAKQTMR